jgi:simple sugar transport system permease protein
VRIGSYRIKLQKRVSLSNWQAVSISVLAIIVALILFSLIFILAGINPLVAYREIFSYSFANPFGLPLTVNRFIFLLLCTYAFIIPFRAGLWNIGMTGQLYAGALAVYAVLFAFGANEFNSTYPSAWVLIPVMLIAAAVGGAALGAIAGYLKGKYNINEIVVTMMLNFMTFWLVSFMIKEGGLFMNAGGRGESFELPDALRAPLIMDIPITVFLALGVGLLLTYLFARTRIG